MKRLFFLAALFVWFAPAFASAQGSAMSILLIYETGGKPTDRAFIDMARSGAERAKRELEVDYQEVTIDRGQDRTAVFEQYAMTGTDLIIALGSQNVSTVLNIAGKYPDTNFTVIDGMIPPLFNNVQSIVFRDNEGAFMVGVIAAMHSKTGKIGFIGGKDSPIIRDFAYGYQQGAEYAKPEIQISRDMIGKTEEAWSNPSKAAALAAKQIEQGADVIFAAAGGSSDGMLEEVAGHNDIWSIGVDTNQNYRYPGSVLTSLVKRVDKAVFGTISQMLDKSWQPGIKYMGINEGALDYSVDKFNKNLLGKDIIDETERAKDLIMQGVIKVDNYSPK